MSARGWPPLGELLAAQPALVWSDAAGDPLEDMRRWAERMRAEALAPVAVRRPFCARTLMREEWLTP